MKIQYFFILLFGIQVASAQINQKNAGQLVDRLHHALMSRDHDELNTLLDSRLSYGHSNLWIESKQELISNNTSTLTIILCAFSKIPRFWSIIHCMTPVFIDSYQNFGNVGVSSMI